MFESDFLTSAVESKKEYQDLLSKTVELICESLPPQAYSGQTPATLATLIHNDFFPGHESSPGHISDLLRTIIANSINVSDPHTAAHLHCQPLLAALAAEVVISALNQSMDSFDQAPIATVVEQKIVRWLCSEAGLPATADGTFTTGGSQSNYMGLLLARDAYLQKRWHWSAQKSGLPAEARKLRILCSEAAHFTVEKSAAQLGLGTDSVIRVSVDEQFRMEPHALSGALSQLQHQDLLPLVIVATAGTTDSGSIDPLREIAAMAREAGAWLHVDAAYGGALLFSPQHRQKLAGIEYADSIAIDFHKLFWQPIPCSAFLLRDASHFDSLKMHADYLNPELHEAEGIPNLVTTSLLTSRRFDTLKLWISLQALGREKFARMIDHTIVLANHAAEVIRNTPQLELICDPQLSTVVFRYLPSANRGDADVVNARIRQNLLERGVAVIGHTRVHNRQWLKFTCMNPTASEADLETLLGMIVEEGRAQEKNSRTL
ncbi:MAG TPA: aspartate aminotransferase family protein [Candidatus Sulfotelmatobacter sp.]|nr:aspartate aminotransferase family protein [Candidatus Sulfotelmatobacter sp.]